MADGRQNVIGRGFKENPGNINKNGRPKGIKNRSTIARKWLDTKTKWVNPISGKEEYLSLEDQITIAQIKAARDNEMSPAYKALMDSAHGAVQQKVDLTSGGEVMTPALNVYNIAPPMAGSEDEIDNVRPQQIEE